MSSRLHQMDVQLQNQPAVSLRTRHSRIAKPINWLGVVVGRHAEGNRCVERYVLQNDVVGRAYIICYLYAM
jgi:hypothetical protein